MRYGGVGEERRGEWRKRKKEKEAKFETETEIRSKHECVGEKMGRRNIRETKVKTSYSELNKKNGRNMPILQALYTQATYMLHAQAFFCTWFIFLQTQTTKEALRRKKQRSIHNRKQECPNLSMYVYPVILLNQSRS